MEVEKCVNLHNHELPLTVGEDGVVQSKDLRASSSVRQNVILAASQNNSLTARDLALGVGQPFMPGLATNALDERAIQRLKERACSEIVGPGGMSDYLRDFDSKRRSELMLQVEY
ncbi:MAG: hypothetical protein GY820_21515 [Gammaproteobacteria bacterium]|nr:hypothetical protein [Gammaproteobacteria bacterium]